MGSITLSGFNNIDFNMILGAIMEQERLPLRTLQSERASLEARKDSFAALAGNLAALRSAAESLSGAAAFGGRSLAVSDTSALSVSAGAGAAAGTYEVVVNSLARAQVTTTSSVHADKDTTIVASGGSIEIGGVSVQVSGDTTLQQLADRINATADIGVSATVVHAAGNYYLVLTGTKTGAANAFTVTNNLTGVTFSASNAVDAADADLTVNNVRVTSASNIVEGAVAGCTLTLLEENPGVAVTVTITRDLEATKELVGKFVSAFNDLVHFMNRQATEAIKGSAGNIGRDALIRGLNGTLRSLVHQEHAATGPFRFLSEIGLGFNRTGELTFDEARFDQAASESLAGIEALFSGNGDASVFRRIEDAIDTYIGTGGLVAGAQSRIDGQVRSIDQRMADLERRLAIRQEALQLEFMAADAIMSQLNAQMGSLSSLASQYRLF